MWEWVQWVWGQWGEAVWHLVWAAYYWITFNEEATDTELQYFKGKIQTIYMEVWGHIEDAYNRAVDWADEFITSLLNSVSNIWNSITSIWAQFGAAFLDGFWTVVSWVEDKVTGVTTWVQSNYDEAKRLAIGGWNWIIDKGHRAWVWVDEKADSVWSWIVTKADTVWDWISTKGDTVWDWITDFVSPITDWVTKYINFYIDLFENYNNMLLTFLEDPERFIADRAADALEYIVSQAVLRFW